jgi:hypothetical protein
VTFAGIHEEVAWAGPTMFKPIERRHGRRRDQPRSPEGRPRPPGTPNEGAVREQGERGGRRRRRRGRRPPQGGPQAGSSGSRQDGSPGPVGADGPAPGGPGTALGPVGGAQRRRRRRRR